MSFKKINFGDNNQTFSIKIKGVPLCIKEKPKPSPIQRGTLMYTGENEDNLIQGDKQYNYLLNKN